MIEACYCDYDDIQPAFFRRSTPVAKQQHKCISCGRAVMPGEKYERCAGKWEDRVSSHATCCRCLAVRDYVEAHIPCFCWYYETLLEDAIEHIREALWQEEVPGMWMEFGRLVVAARRAPAFEKETWR